MLCVYLLIHSNGLVPSILNQRGCQKFREENSIAQLTILDVASRPLKCRCHTSRVSREIKRRDITSIPCPQYLYSSASSLSCNAGRVSHLRYRDSYFILKLSPAVTAVSPLYHILSPTRTALATHAKSPFYIYHRPYCPTRQMFNNGICQSIGGSLDRLLGGAPQKVLSDMDVR